MTIYTRTGDKGKTGTFSGKRVSKSSLLINTIGEIDELNSYLGVIGGLQDIQKKLFTINSILSGANLFFDKNDIRTMEREIDEMEAKLPVLANFILYGGCQGARELYYARSLCRRAERSLVSLQELANLEIDISTLLKYLNRLSDYLFTLARYINFKKKIKEEPWN